MKHKIILFRIATMVAILFSLSVADSKSQVVPSEKINKILKSIYDRPMLVKFALDAYQFDGYGKKLAVFGTNHGIRNPSDSMFVNIEQEFASLSPNVIFSEAISSYLHPTRDQNIQMGGDMALPRYLAYKNGLEAHIWDLSNPFYLM